MTTKLQRETKETLYVDVTSDVDPTGTTVEWSFALVGTRPAVWTAGSWDGTATEVDDVFVTSAASPTVGGSGSDAAVKLDPGLYEVYTRVDDSPNRPVLRVDDLRME